METVENGTETVENGAKSREIYLSAIELAGLLKISDNDLSRLARSGVLERIPRPDDARAFLYPVLANVTKYVLYLRSAKEKAHVSYLQERSRLQKIQRCREELQYAAETGGMISKERVFSVIGAGIISFKQAMLSRGERLAAMLSQLPDREAQVEAIRGDDVRLLGMLADSLKAIDSDGG
jgi:hypothetical protein